MIQMTVQEAIEILRDTPIDIRSTREDDIHTLYATAQGMAIEALQFVAEYHQTNIEAYAHDMGVSLEQAERELRVQPKTAESGSVDSEMPEIKTDRTNDRLIWQQDAIEQIKLLYEGREDDIYDRLWNRALKGATNAIKHHTPSAQPERKKGEWIPTKIAKPPKAGHYLVTKQQKTGACQIATAHYNPSFDEWSGNGNFKKILAWQPLPSPYQEES